MTRAAAGFVTLVLVMMVRTYQQVLAPHLPAMCRFEPSCSRYAVEALERHGAWRGLGFTVRRLLRCRPGRDFW